MSTFFLVILVLCSSCKEEGKVKTVSPLIGEAKILVDTTATASIRDDVKADLKEVIRLNKVKDSLANLSETKKTKPTRKQDGPKQGNPDESDKTSSNENVQSPPVVKPKEVEAEQPGNKILDIEPKPVLEKPVKEVIVENKPKTEIVLPTVQLADHIIFDKLLRKYVSTSGVVDYSGFKSAEAELDVYLLELRNNPIQKGISRTEKMAYWINAYNAYTIKLILNNYPVASIMDIHGGKAWDKSWIKLGQNTYSLNQIEHEILRPQFKDPRIHFAVNCAAKSCPPIANTAYTASNLESLLEKSTKAFILNEQYNSVDGSEWKLSKIFEWYAVDFPDLAGFINKYASTGSSSPNISYNEYLWALNGK